MNGVIGFVAFRAGSKRLPKKNGRLLGEKTLYQITLDKLVALKQQGSLGAVVVSTDSEEWRTHCVETYGDEVLFHHRPAIVSGDRASDTEVVLDFFEQHPDRDRQSISERGSLQRTVHAAWRDHDIRLYYSQHPGGPR